MSIDIENAFEISIQQKKICLLQKPGQTYQTLAAFAMQGHLAEEVLHQAIQKIVEEYEIFRTVFLKTPGLKFPRQVIVPENDFFWRVLSFESDSEQALEQVWREEEQVAIPIEQGPLLRITLVKLTEEYALLFMNLPSLCADSWTIHNLMQAILQRYQQLQSQGNEQEVLDETIQYADFTGWQHDTLDEIEIHDAPQKQTTVSLELPLEREAGLFCPRQVSFTLNTHILTACQEISAQYQTTEEAFLLSCWYILLYRLSGQNKILLDYLDRGRQIDELCKSMGPFELGLPLFCSLDGDMQFVALLTQIASQLAQTQQEQESYQKSLNTILNFPPGKTIASEIAFRYIVPKPGNSPSSLTTMLLREKSVTAPFKILLSSTKIQEKVLAALHYDEAHYEHATIQRMVAQLTTLLEQVVRHPAATLDELDIISHEESQLLEAFNTSSFIEQDEGKTLQQLFETQVELVPDAIAVVCGKETLTFAELNAKANQLGHLLRKRGVGADTLVGVFLERSIEMIVSVIGILKAGGAYLPLDPDTPQERLATILADGCPHTILTQEQIKKRLPTHSPPSICLDTDWTEIGQASPENLEITTLPEHLAYVIYTSGTTGKPKGVLIQHNSVTHLLAALRQQIYTQFSPHIPLRIAVNGSLTFDTSVKQIFQLLYGYTLHLIPAAMRFEPELLVAYLADQQIDVIDCTPSQLILWINAGLLQPEQRRPGAILLGGESIPPALWQHLASTPGTDFFNLYGPTECTVDTTSRLINPTDLNTPAPTIGRPLPGIAVSILDRYQRRVPLGVSGELYIGGAGVARGYLKDGALTASKFLPDPFQKGGKRLYRSGDTARYRADGTIEFLGRIDRQVKIRGYRVELADIEITLCQHKAVREAVVQNFEHAPNDLRLAAYLVLHQGTEASIGDLRSFLAEQLPDYMIPATFTFLKHLPLTAHGKVDYRALPPPKESERSERVFVAPHTTIEKILAEVWCELLGVTRISCDDNFFELGGDSILCIQATARAKQRGLRLMPIQMFQNQTIASLAQVVDTLQIIEAEQGIISTELPLTPIQHRFFERHLQEPAHWNQSLLLEVSAPLPFLMVQQAFKKLVEHHDALRLRFLEEAGDWKQIHAASEENAFFAQHDLTSVPDETVTATIEQIATNAQKSLNITHGPLLHVAYFSSGGNRSDYLLIIIHHLAIDGVSWRILLEDLETLLHQLLSEQPMQLPAKTTSYQTWATQLHHYGQSAEVQKELTYWKEQFRTPSSTLPRDYEDQGENTVASITQFEVTVSRDETQLLLREVPTMYRAQMHEVLLASLVTAVSRWSCWSKNSSLLVNLEGHGREEIVGQVDLSRTIGWFTTVYPVLFSVEPQHKIEETLRSVKDQIRAVPNKGIGYGLLRYLNKDHATITQLVAMSQAEIGFNYLGQFDQAIGADLLLKPTDKSCGPVMSPLAKRSYLLELDASIINGQLHLHWTYSKNIYRQSKIESLAQVYIEQLQRLTTKRSIDCQQRYLPSDFPFAKLTQEQIDTIQHRYTDIEDLYAASPLQCCMLERMLYAPRYGHYLYQWKIDLEAAIETSAFACAWETVIARHPEMRTSFFWEQGSEPVQIVHRAARVSIHQFNWQDLSSIECQAEESGYLQSTQEQGFALNEIPLLSIALVHLGQERCRILINFSLLTLDVPSFALIVDEVLACYHTLQKNNRELAQGTSSYSYKEYLEWVLQQDETAARNFWRDYLADIPTITPLLQKPEQLALAKQKNYNEPSIFLSQEFTQQLQAFAQRHQITINTILQGIWAIFLKEYTGQSDVVFGTIVSGRPTSLEEVEKRTGRFVNFLPVRMKVPEQGTFISWVKETQKKLFEMLQFEYISEEQINTWCNFPPYQHLFQSLVAYENAPLQNLLEAPHWQGVSALTIIQDPDVPLKLTGTLFDCLRITLAYIPGSIEEKVIQHMLERVSSLLSQLVQSPDTGLCFPILI